ncbi:MAG: hypothetical protein KDA59_25085 [Planctomycetales bacterium]|nr:hypothetical protein [Planctomycetales bacterium]
MNEADYNVSLRHIKLIDHTTFVNGLRWPNVRAMDCENSALAVDPSAVQLSESNLESLNLAGTNATDDFLRMLPDMPRLQELNVSRTTVTGSGLIDFRNSPALETLSLRGTNLSNDTLKYLRLLPNLKRLDLSHTAIDNRGIYRLRHNTKLISLDLCQTRIDRDASIVDLVGHLPELQFLYVNGTQVDDSFIEAIKGFPKLHEIHVAGTNVSANALRKMLQAMPQGYLQYLNGIGYGLMRGSGQPQMDAVTEKEFGGVESSIFFSKYDTNLEPRKRWQ